MKKILYNINGVLKKKNILFAVLLSFSFAISMLYSFNVYAYRDTEEYSFSSLSWDIGENAVMAYWDRSDKAQSYKVQLYKDNISNENKVGNPMTVSNKDHCDLTKLILDRGMGSYIFTVTGLKNGVSLSSELKTVSAQEYDTIEENKHREQPTKTYGTYRKKQERGPGVEPVQNIKDRWIKLANGNWYHYTDGEMDYGWYTDKSDGSTYFLKADGSMAIGWYYENGKSWKFDRDGRLQSDISGVPDLHRVQPNR